MIKYTHFKINLGLSVINCRNDGFHNIETVMYSVVDKRFCDIIEFAPFGGVGVEFSNSGIEMDCAIEDNLCVRAARLLEERGFLRQGVQIHLHKQLPFGAGLGAGSANCAGVLVGLNEFCSLGLSGQKLEELAAELGSDTTFFVENGKGGAAITTKKGEVIEPISIDLSGYFLVLVKPHIGISTKEAYSGITPKTPEIPPHKAVQLPIERWKEVLFNDFENTVFKKLPTLLKIKEKLYDFGALYSAMSGSGSTIYGIFKTPPTPTTLTTTFPNTITKTIAL